MKVKLSEQVRARMGALDMEIKALMNGAAMQAGIVGKYTMNPETGELLSGDDIPKPPAPPAKTQEQPCAGDNEGR